MNYYIGIDSGGTFMKAGLFDAAGRQIGLSRVSASVVTEREGWVERVLDDIWSDARAAIKDLLKKTDINVKDIKGLSISAQGKGVYLLDKEGKDLRNGIMSSDSRSLSIVKRWLQDGLPAKVYPMTLQTLWTGHPVSIVRWLKDNEPESYANIGAILMAHDYLRYRLTGAVHGELTNMSESNFFNASSGTYDKELLSIFGIDEVWDALPPILKSNEQAGVITKEAAEETGLLAGTPVFGGLFDVVATAICSGINATEDKLNFVMGTWAVTSGIATEWTKTDHNFVYGYYAIDDQYIVHEASPTSASNYEWFNDYLKDDSGKFDHAAIEAQVAALPVASGSLFFVPFLFGSNMGLGIKSGFYGLQSHHKKADWVQAIWEGIIFCHNVHLDRMRKRFPQAKVLRVTGGPTASEHWMQMLADLTNMTLEIPNVEETGSLGAATVAMVGNGEYASVSDALAALTGGVRQVDPNPENFSAYQKKFQRYLQLVRLFKEFEDDKNA